MASSAWVADTPSSNRETQIGKRESQLKSRPTGDFCGSNHSSLYAIDSESESVTNFVGKGGLGLVPVGAI